MTTEKSNARATNAPFCVGERPFCVWDPHLHETNLRFVRDIRPEYLAFLATSHLSALEHDSTAMDASIAIRLAYFHALETALAMTFAALQSPSCLFGWLGRYRLEDLDDLLACVEGGRRIRNRLRIDTVTWRNTAAKILEDAPFEEHESEVQRSVVEQGFAYSLEQIASEFSDLDFREEYNSLKHGFRVNSGGFNMWMLSSAEGSEKESDSKPFEFGGSKFGSTIFHTSKINGDKVNYCVEPISVNWSPATLASRMNIVSAWIRCLQAFLLHNLSDAPMNLTWGYFATEEEFTAPWRSRAGAKKLRITPGLFDPLKGPTGKVVLDSYDKTLP